MTVPKIWLEVAEGPNQGDVIPVRQPRFLIGRRTGCHFRPAGEGIADLDCAIVSREGRFYLRKYGASGEQVASVTELHDGHRFHVGKWHLHVRIEAVAEPRTELPPVAKRPPTSKEASQPAKAGRRVIVVGRKDVAVSMIGQRALDTQTKIPARPAPPKAKASRPWLPVAAGGVLLFAFIGVVYLAIPSKKSSAPAAPSLSVPQNHLTHTAPRPPRRRVLPPNR